jgi:LPXTG-motif cell wall-anchored protein
LIPESRWLAYATAGAATVLTSVNSLEAAIHYSGPLRFPFPPDSNLHKTFRLGRPGYSFELDHKVSGHAAFTIIGDVRGRIYPYASRLNSGDKISVGPFAGGYVGWMVRSHDAPFKQWKRPGIGFIGFSFESSGNHYGWVRVEMAGNGKNNGFRLLDYAWADAGEAIAAGQTSSDEQVPTLGSLGLLATGAVGLLLWRKRRSAAAS